MAKTLSKRSETDQFINGVLFAAEHHAPGVLGAVSTIYDFMIVLVDFKRDKVEVFERNGQEARTTWIVVSGTRIVFSYDYKRKCILIRQKTTRGRELANFLWNESKETTIEKLISALTEAGIPCSA